MRHILHADFDAFYASVEQRDKPELRDKPVIVGGSPEQRGVVASASYEARVFGIKSAIPMRRALELCPHASRINPRFDIYSEVSKQLMIILSELSDLVEPLSLDEAYMDITSRVTRNTPPILIASDLKNRVMKELGLTISVGISTNKSIAKVASDMNKPDGITVVAPGTEREFLAPLPIDKLWGIGPKTSALLNSQGIESIGQMTLRPKTWWSDQFGKGGQHLLKLALGKDDDPVIGHRPRKSISAETTLIHDSADPEILTEFTRRLSHNVYQQSLDARVQGRTVKLKMRLSDFTTFSRQKTMLEPIRSTSEITLAATALLDVELKSRMKFRLIGITLSGLEPIDQKPLQPKLNGFE